MTLYRHLRKLNEGHIVERRYNAVQYNMILHTSLFRVRSWNNGMQCMSFYILIAVTEAEYKSWFEPTEYIPFLPLTGELWDVFCEIFLWKSWLRYNGTALYISFYTGVSNFIILHHEYFYSVNEYLFRKKSISIWNCWWVADVYMNGWLNVFHFSNSSICHSDCL